MGQNELWLGRVENSKVEKQMVDDSANAVKKTTT